LVTAEPCLEDTDALLLQVDIQNALNSISAEAVPQMPIGSSQRTDFEGEENMDKTVFPLFDIK